MLKKRLAKPLILISIFLAAGMVYTLPMNAATPPKRGADRIAGSTHGY